MIKKHTLVILFISIILFLIAIFGISEFFKLQKAHATFENYYAFRGCIQLIEKTDAYGTCKLSSGNIIKIVKINDTWYLDGDGPGMW